MRIFKLLVLICFVRSAYSLQERFCAICDNHTLCKFPVKGPSTACVGYDKAAQLTSKNILEIVNRINERRNYVALGQLNRFPQAANMKKVRWSLKLASFAQRWADQCDPSVKPDREDECRDLASMQVGQNIATVMGPTSGLSVKSFVDIWFMMNLNFMGSVAFYNESKESVNNYFTQIIWAETMFVGCGRVKFFVDGFHTVVERLVCNFAPKGNIVGKPIYTIGYPGTQCSSQMIPDIDFPALCLQTTEPAPKLFDKDSSASSLLRILNLSNNSLKQDLDPNNLKQINLNSSEMNHQRNQKTRHVYPNNANGAIKRDSIHLQNSMRNMEGFNGAHYTQHSFTQEKGHSRMYHGYQTSKEPVFNQEISHVHTDADFRRSDFTSSIPFYSSSIQDARKHLMDNQCTRKMVFGDSLNCYSTDPPCKVKNNECARPQFHNCQKANTCQPSTICPCNEPAPPPIPPIQCNCNRKCPPTTSCFGFTTTYCPYRKVGGGEPDQSNQFDNYDLFHNLEVKSGEDDSSRKQPWHYEKTNSDKLDKSEYIGSESDPYRKVKTFVEASQPKIRKPQDLFSSFDYSEREKRDLEDQTFKPFWQMDEYNQKRPSELKSLRYTTLANKRHRKTRTSATTTKLLTSTETITIKSKEKPSVSYNRGRVTEKYLSFDELMHLRKLSTAVNIPTIDSEARRRADSFDLREGTTVDPSKTTTITANTPFIRQKHCTRKLTCTWTAAINGSGGGAGGGGGGGGGYNVGSRTPPGYVDGCTRTSTCTRDYMDRNKMATSSENPNGDGSGTTLEDEDYCERRSLNIRRRNLDENRGSVFGNGYQKAFTVLPVDTKLDEIVSSTDNSDDEPSSQTDNFHCICYDDTTRVKRGELSRFKQLFSRGCKCMKSNINSKRLLYNNDFSVGRTTRSKYSKSFNQCYCNGTKSLQDIFYWTITLRNCVTWITILLQLFIMRTFEV